MMAWYVRPVVLFAAYFLVFGILQLALPSVGGQRVFRQGFFVDCVYWLWAAVTHRSEVTIVAALLVIGATRVGGLGSSAIAHGYGPLALQPIWLQTVEAFLLGDFLNYWSHRMRHQPLFWRFHKVHHSSRELDWLSSTRGHPIDNLLKLFTITAPLLAAGFAALPVALYFFFSDKWMTFVHSNIDWDWRPLRGLIVSPIFHRWHHTKLDEGSDKNFAGLFPIWDALFGTHFMPAERPPRHFGLVDAFPDDILGQLIAPFVGTKPGGNAMPAQPVKAIE